MCIRDSSYTVRGLVTPPKNARASRAMQYFFINGRFVKNLSLIHISVLEAEYHENWGDYVLLLSLIHI